MNKSVCTGVAGNITHRRYDSDWHVMEPTDRIRTVSRGNNVNVTIYMRIYDEYAKSIQMHECSR